MSKTIVRPYNAKLNVKGERIRYIKDTIQYMKNAEIALHDLGGAVLSYVTTDIAKDIAPDLNPDFVKSVCRFRLVSKEHKITLSENVNVLTEYEKAYGKNITDIELAYISSKYNKDLYRWQDTRHLVKPILAKTKLTEEQFKEFSIAILKNGSIIGCAGGPGAASAVSQLFGKGEKADYAAKGVIAQKCSDALIKFKPAKLEDARDLLVKENGYKNAEDLIAAYGIVGAKSSLRIFMEDKTTGEFPPKRMEALIKKLKKDAELNSRKGVIPHREKITEYLSVFVGVKNDFFTKAWVEAWNNFSADVNAKIAHNQLFAEEKDNDLKLLKQIEKENPDLNKAVAIFNKYMNTVAEDCRFIVAPYHLGDFAKFKSFFDGGIGSFEDKFSVAWDDYNNSMGFDEKPPIRELVKFITQNGLDVTPDVYIKACKWVKTKDKIEYRYPHPFVVGNKGYTFGKFNIDGAINNPNMKLPNGDISGSRPMIWVTAKLLDNGKWISHHLPFANSRYFEEVYFTNPKLPTLPYARDGKHGYTLGKTLDETAIKAIKESGNRKNAAKAIERIKANATHNVEWDDRTTFSIRESNGSYMISVNHRHPVIDIPRDINVGDRILGFDQNESAPTTYAILEKVSSEGIPYNGNQYKVVKMGKVQGLVKGKWKTSDVFHYMGLDIDDKNNGFKDLVDKCAVFVKENGNKHDVSYFENMISWTKHLYNFHAQYANILKRIMRRAGKDKLKIYRDHINDLLFKSALSPLKLHSLALRSLDATKKVNSLINCYFSIYECKTIEDKEKKDKPLYEATVKLNKSLVQRRKERVRLTAGILVRLCHEHNVKFIFGEDELPTMDSGKSRSNNSAKADWCSRELATKVKEMCIVVGINFKGIMPHYTSHQDPFVHSKSKKTMRARYSWYRKEDFGDRDAVFIRSTLAKESVGTNVYYQEAIKDFAKKYNLDLAEMKKRKDGKWYQDRLPESFLAPRKGGRVYLSTHKLINNETVTDSNGNKLYVNDADEVAAINVALVAI